MGCHPPSLFLRFLLCLRTNMGLLAADYKSRIVQRGAVPPLIDMLSAADVAIKEMAAFALGRLAQNSHNQAGIVQSKGLVALLELLESKHYNLQHNAAFALYGLSDNEDNVPCIIKHGGLQKLVNCEERLQVQASKVGNRKKAWTMASVHFERESGWQMCHVFLVQDVACRVVPQ